MIYTPVSSSNVKEVAYDNGMLHVRFHTGGEGHYEGVTPEMYGQFMAAPSKGKFIYHTVRPAARWVPKVK